MQTTLSGKKHVYFMWLTGGALVTMATFAVLRALEANRTAAAATHVAERDSDLEGRVEHLQEQISLLKLQNQPIIQQAPAASVNIPIEARKPEAESAPEMAEEHLAEQVQQRIDKRYALLEKRFSDEPVSSAERAGEEKTVREHIQKLPGYELTRIECRSTMCRIEIKSDSADAAAMLSQLGLTEGGEVRRREGSSFLIFAGRVGFPFQEVNRVE